MLAPVKADNIYENIYKAYIHPTRARVHTSDPQVRALNVNKIKHNERISEHVYINLFLLQETPFFMQDFYPEKVVICRL